MTFKALFDQGGFVEADMAEMEIRVLGDAIAATSTVAAAGRLDPCTLLDSWRKLVGPVARTRLSAEEKARQQGMPPRPPMQQVAAVTPDFLHAAETFFYDAAPTAYALVWRVAGDDYDWTVPPGRGGQRDWSNNPTPHWDTMSPSVQAYVAFDEFEAVHKRQWNCGVLKHQFHRWWDDRLSPLNTLFLLAAEPRDVITMRNQAIVGRGARVLGRWQS